MLQGSRFPNMSKEVLYMFNLFGKKKKDENPIDHADKVMNKGLSGLMMKGFVPKEHRDRINEGLNSARNAQLSSSGIPVEATAIVEEVMDTGKLINFDPIVVLKLKVTDRNSKSHDITLETLVSKLQIPRIGDQVGLGLHPTKQGEWIYMGLI
jgi:hypothetical protein